ncbi:MAG: ATP-binding protein [Defluviitaleaceae bacterium]|nr:ATP-binding protein [Defluviitaleaceae bacterium]
MNKMIFIGGFPVAGKSTFATRLSERLRIPVFHKDIIREKMADGFGRENVELINADKKGSKATMHLMHHIAEQFMQTGNACIMESNFSVLYPQPVSEVETYKLLYCVRSRLDEISIGQTLQVDTTDFAKVDFNGLFILAEDFMYSRKTTFTNT